MAGRMTPHTHAMAICAHCADECDNQRDDPYMAACAEICRRAAESCAEMADATP